MWAVHCSAEVFSLHICGHIRSTREFGEIICVIELFKADLLADPESFVKVMEECKYAMHNASPFQSSTASVMVPVPKAASEFGSRHSPSVPSCLRTLSDPLAQSNNAHTIRDRTVSVSSRDINSDVLSATTEMALESGATVVVWDR